MGAPKASAATSPAAGAAVKRAGRPPAITSDAAHTRSAVGLRNRFRLHRNRTRFMGRRESHKIYYGTKIYSWTNRTTEGRLFNVSMIVHNCANDRSTRRAIERARTFPEDQDDFARVLLQLTGEEQPIYELSAEEEASLEPARRQAARGEFATDERMAAIWAKHGL